MIPRMLPVSLFRWRVELGDDITVSDDDEVSANNISRLEFYTGSILVDAHGFLAQAKLAARFESSLMQNLLVIRALDRPVPKRYVSHQLVTQAVQSTYGVPVPVPSCFFLSAALARTELSA